MSLLAVSFSSFTIQPWSAAQRFTAACTSGVTVKALKPWPLPTSAVAVGDAANGGALFHLTALCNHEALMRCKPWVSVALLALLPAEVSAVAVLMVEPK